MVLLERGRHRGGVRESEPAVLEPEPAAAVAMAAGGLPDRVANNAGANWPVQDMAKDSNGVWSFTTPLPSGVFTYQFYKDCDADAPALPGCTAFADPGNPPWNTVGSIERTSQVYVPSDPAFGTVEQWRATALPLGRSRLAPEALPCRRLRHLIGRPGLLADDPMRAPWQKAPSDARAVRSCVSLLRSEPAGRLRSSASNKLGEVF